MRARRRYDDKFRASAVVMLEAAGYPDKEGALTQTANHLGIPLNTLKGWFTAEHNPPPAKLRKEKKLEFAELLRDEIYGALNQAKLVRADATYRDLITGAAILIDKLQLLEGKPTWIGEITNLLKTGELTPQDVLDELGDGIETRQLLESAGILTIEGRAVEVASEEKTESSNGN